MTRIIWTSLSGLMAVSLCSAAPDAKTAVKNAATQLADKANYTWTSTSKPEGDQQGPTMTTEGKTEKGGYTLLALTFGDRTFDVALKGGKVAVKTEDEWRNADELEGRGAWMARLFKEFRAPAAEAQELADNAKALKAGAEGLCSGDLTEKGVKDYFARFGRGGQAPEATDVKGWVKFWVKDGALTKYEFNVQGKITVGQDNREMDINRTTTVEIKDVGTTKVTVPDDAKKKLS